MKKEVIELKGVIDAERIFEEIKNEIKLDKIFSYNAYTIIICYILWKMKTDSSIRSLDDIEWADSFCEPFEDICVWIEEDQSRWKKMEEMASKYTAEEFAACITDIKPFENDLVETVPEGIGLLADRILDLKKGDKVYQLNCNLGEYLIQSRERNKGVIYTGHDMAYFSMMIADFIAQVKGLDSISFEREAELDGYNKIFATAPMTNDGVNYIYDTYHELEDALPDYPSKESGSWNMCALAAYHIKKNGKAVAVINGGQLDLSTVVNARKYLCENGYIEGVIMLAKKMYDNTWISPYIIILGKNNKKIRFLDASNEYVASRSKGKRINVIDSSIADKITDMYKSGESTVEISITEIKKNDYNLNPSRYVIKSNINADMKELGEFIVETKRGVTMGSSEQDKLVSDVVSGKKCIFASNISEGVVNSNLYFQGEIKKPGKNEASRGDLLITKTGMPFKVAVADDNYLVIGNVYIVKVNKDKISPEYLKCYLSSRQGQSELSRFATGAPTFMINVSNLPKVKVPVFEDKKQEDLSKRAEEIVEELRSCYRQIQDRNEELDSMFEEA